MRPAAGALLALLLWPSAPDAQTPFDRARNYDRCASEAYRRAGAPPRTHPQPGDDLARLERGRQDYEDRYYRYLDDCLRVQADPRNRPRG